MQGIKAANEAYEKTEKALKDEWGNEYKENLDKAERATQMLFDDEDREFIKSSKLGNHPGFVKAMRKLFDRIKEDEFIVNDRKKTDTDTSRDPDTGLPMLDYPSMKK
jgi:hypothetical protein